MNIRTFTLLALCAVCLSACACPRPATYEGTPYGHDRTAGTGLHEEGCLKRSLPGM